jgi:hypothetical protein
MHDAILRAVQKYELDQNHNKVYDDPNELIEIGFPASFILPLIRVFRSREEYKYFWRGQIVDEMIGISHLSLVYAIAEDFGISSDAGSKFTGRGFAMRAIVDSIRQVMRSA